MIENISSMFTCYSVQSLHAAQEELESMAIIAEKEKLKNLGLEKELQAANQLRPSSDSDSVPKRVQELQHVLQQKERWTELIFNEN